MILPARKRSKRRQHRLERVGLVRVIDQHRDPRFRRAPLRACRGPLGIAAPHTATASISIPRAADRAGRAEDIEQVDFADQRRFDFDFFAEHRKRRANAAQVRVEFLGMHVERSIHSETYFRSFHRVEHAPAERIVAAHDRDSVRALAARQYLGEQPQLRREVIFDRLVIVQMVAAKVGEHAGAEVERIDAPFGDSDRRHFRRRVTHALALHLRQRGLEVERLGRRQSAVDFFAADEDSDGADDSGGHSGRLENRRQDVAGRGLAAGAGDADQIDALARRSEETRGGRAHQQARPLAHHQGHRGARCSTIPSTNHHSARPTV